MKILVQANIPLTKSVNPTHFNVAFTWVLEDGTSGGSASVSVRYPNNYNPDSMNRAIIGAAVEHINASGSYTVVSSDRVILFGGVTEIGN